MRDLSSLPVSPVGPSDHVRAGEGEPLIVYAEFSCPDCAVAAARLRENNASVCFRHFALAARSPRAVKLAIASEAAARQGMFWEFHDSLFADQGRLDDPHLWQRCELLGIDIDRFESDRRDPALAEIVAESATAAMRAGATGAPSFVVGGRIQTEFPAQPR
jgi:protein-disulfide isomerase